MVRERDWLGRDTAGVRRVVDRNGGNVIKLQKHQQPHPAERNKVLTSNVTPPRSPGAPQVSVGNPAEAAVVDVPLRAVGEAGVVMDAVSGATELVTLVGAVAMGDTLPEVEGASVADEFDEVGTAADGEDVVVFRPRADERKDESAAGAAVPGTSAGARVP